jgi:hypothetical protein
LIRSTLSVTDEAAPTVSDAPGEVTSTVAAVIVVIPAVVPAVASPLELIIAVVVFEEFQVTEFVKSWNVPSLKVPIARNCCVPLIGSVAELGNTFMAVKLAVGADVSANMTASGSWAPAVLQLVQVGWKPFTVVVGVVFP